MSAVADAYVDAYKRGDKEALLDLFAPDAYFEDPVGQPAHVGRQALQISRLHVDAELARLHVHEDLRELRRHVGGMGVEKQQC